jgi:hypothetical protein
MSKCYYCNGTDKFCVECKRAAAKAATPSPNGKNPCAEVKVSTVLRSRSAEEIYQELKKSQPETPPKEKLYGWVSWQHQRHCQTVIYRHIDGSEVEISFVTLSPTHHGTGWTDCKCIGEVTDFIRRS